MMFDVNHLKRRAGGVSLATLLLSLVVCASPVWAQEAPPQEGSLQIKPPMIKPPMGRSQNTNSGGVKSSRRRRRKITRSRRRARPRTVATRSEQFDNESVGVHRTPIISGGVLDGKAITLPKPSYPAIARSANASGMVVVEVLINEMGDVSEAKAISGHALLRAAAVEAARQAKFTPTKLSGQPVKVTGSITYNFVP